MCRAIAGLLFLTTLLFGQTKNSGPNNQGPNNQGPNNQGWYRSPALSGDTIAFTSEGDLWLVGLEGGLARRDIRGEQVLDILVGELRRCQIRPFRIGGPNAERSRRRRRRRMPILNWR